MKREHRDLQNIQKRLDEVVQFLKLKKDTLAIFVGGSLGRGQADRFSDIDILVITRAKPKFIRYYDGLLDIEVETVTFASMKNKLYDDPATWYAWQNLVTRYDPNNIAPSVKRILREYKRKFRTPKLKLGDWYIRLRHCRQKCARGGRDKNHDAALALYAISVICQSEIARRNIITPPSAKVITFCLESVHMPLALKSTIRCALHGRMPAHNLVPLIDRLLPKLEPVMKNFSKYYKKWK